MPRPDSSLAPAVETLALRRTFTAPRNRGGGPVEALAGVDVRIERGEIFGLLGPNGAGKTTFIKILTTLLFPTAGEARVAGHDVVREAGEVRRRISLVSGGDNAGYGILTVRESLWMFSQFYGVPNRESRERSEMLLDRLGLREKADERVNRLSTGFKQRLNFARGFMSDPEIVFLDEPTLGLDVESARQLRLFLREWMAEKAGQRTVVLTTHYMAEADELCDRIAIVDHGRILALGTPDELKRRVQRESVFRIELDRLDGGVAALRQVPGVVTAAQAAADQGDGKADRQTILVNLALVDDAALGGVVGALGGLGAQILALRKSEPSLEDVFVELVGRGFHEDVDSTPKDSTPRARREPPASDPTDDARERETEVVA